MIVTRQRRKPFPWKRVLIVALPIAAVAFAFAWAPSRTWIAAQPALAPVEAAFNPVVLRTQLDAQNRQISRLHGELAAAQAQLDDRGEQISRLQTQLARMEQQAAPVHVPAQPKPASTAIAGGTADLTTQATPDMRRTAQVWAAMDPDSASKVVERLPIDYVARIFALMPADAAGAILDTLPASYAARLTQERPELSR